MAKQKELPPPPFTIAQARAAIPAHCFERSVLKSFSYVGVNFLCIAFIYYLSSFIQYLPSIARPVAWFAWCYLQGLFFTGVWVLGHDCGHQGFSDYKWLNNAVGWVLHSMLLVPFHSWRITHGMHHKSTNHMDRDQVFVPPTRSSFAENFEDTPLFRLVQLLVFAFFGWPAYLIANVTSSGDYKTRANHFEPSSPIFKPAHYQLIVWSDIGLIFAFAGLGYLTSFYGIANVTLYYIVPYLWTNFWLVSITFLNHTHVEVPHYRGEEWTFIRGALATIDRSYGICNTIFHHIGDTHVAHHMFSTMPHYHAVEATEHLKKFLGNYYIEDHTPKLTALWNTWRDCLFVEDEGEVLFFKKSEELRKSVKKEE